MLVVHLGTTDAIGGAARAMYRWHQALRESGTDSKILCLRQKTADESVSSLSIYQATASFRLGETVQRFAIDQNRTDFSDIYFTHAYGAVSILEHPWIRAADLIHVHWVSGFLRLAELPALRQSGKTVCYTPHDLWGLTGGCHYPDRCRNYLEECRDCPMIGPDPDSFIRQCQLAKQQLLAPALHGLICPSRWIRSVFESTAAFRNIPAAVVPYCIDPNNFFPQAKAAARKQLQLDPANLEVLFIAERLDERRKGFEAFKELLRLVPEQPGRPVHYRLVGWRSDKVAPTLSQAVTGYGLISEAETLRLHLCAADVLLYLGTEDNLPNVVLEAMACGTPVLAFATGGVPDLIDNQLNGQLFEVGAVGAVADALTELRSRPELLAQWGQNASDTVARRFAPVRVAQELQRCYEKMSKQPNPEVGKVTSDELPMRVAVESLHELVAGLNRQLKAQEERIKATEERLGPGMQIFEEQLAGLRQSLESEKAQVEIERGQRLALELELARERSKSLFTLFKERFLSR